MQQKPPIYLGLPPLLFFFPPAEPAEALVDGGGMPGMMRCLGTYLAVAAAVAVGVRVLGFGTFPMGTVSLVMKLDADPELPGGRYTPGFTIVAGMLVAAAAAEATLSL